MSVSTQPRTDQTAAGPRPRRPWNLLGTRRRRLGVQTVTLAAFLGGWQAIAKAEWIDPILAPTPVAIAERFWDNLVNIATGGFMLRHLYVTLSEILLGFLLAIVIGVGIGAIISEFLLARTVLMPYLVALNATPRIALAPIILIWFGFGPSSKVIIAAMTATFPILIGTMAGLAATDRPALRLMRAYGATRWQTFYKVRMYDARPYLFAGLETAVVLATIGAVVGEFIGGSEGLGYVIVVANESLDLPYAFGTLIILSITGLLLHKLVVFARVKAVYWRPKDEGTFGKKAAIPGSSNTGGV